MRPGEASEKRSASIYGKKVAASGAGPYEKLDILGLGKWKGWRGENKATTNKSFSLTIDIIKKGIRQAFAMQAKPFYIIDFEDHNERLIVVREKDWVSLFDQVEELQESNDGCI